MKRIFTLFLLVFSVYFYAAIPAGYYTNAVGKSDAALRTSLQTIVTTGHVVLTYTPGLWNAYATTDINPSTGKIWDMYSNCNFTYSVDQNRGTTGPECTNYNREHSVPNSWWGGTQGVAQYSDIVHLVPTDSYVNAQRGNYPYGEVASVSYTSGNGSKLGTSAIAEYSGTVFEPINEFKGDFARIYLYIATRYASECGSWTGGQGTAIFGTPTLGLSNYATQLYLKWSRQDPVSAKEISRNDANYVVQKNRNPFVDYPELAEFIWGNRKGENWSLTSAVDQINVQFSISPNPAHDVLVINSDEEDLTYTLFNLNGQTLKEEKLNFDRTISLSSIQSGMYLLQLKSGNRKSIQKFVVN